MNPESLIDPVKAYKLACASFILQSLVWLMIFGGISLTLFKVAQQYKKEGEDENYSVAAVFFCCFFTCYILAFACFLNIDSWLGLIWPAEMLSLRKEMQ